MTHLYELAEIAMEPEGCMTISAKLNKTHTIAINMAENCTCTLFTTGTVPTYKLNISNDSW